MTSPLSRAQRWVVITFMVLCVVFGIANTVSFAVTGAMWLLVVAMVDMVAFVALFCGLRASQ